MRISFRGSRRPSPVVVDASSIRQRSRGWARATRAAEVGVYAVAALAAVVGLTLPFFQGLSFFAMLAAMLSAAGVAGLRRFPMAALVAVVAAPLVAALAGEEPTGAWSLAVFAAFLLSLRHLPATVVGAVVGAGNLIAVAVFERGISFDQPEASIAAVCGIAGAALGSALRAHQRYTEELEGRARDAINSRQASVEHGVAEERLRIARDLHDSIGHEIAVVSMHLGSAEVNLAADAHEVRASLDAARDAVKSVLSETQQVLRVLRVSGHESALVPTRGHAALPDLIDSYRSAGLEVEETIIGLGVPLPVGTSLAAYRIVQEALTNAQRYGAGSVTLRVQIGDEVLIESVNVRANDPDRAERPGGGGHGLVGMMERAESVDGHVTTWVEGNLFWVRAVLPVDSEGAR